jgi:1,4-alpha-glucan branching enzyme
MRSMLALPAAQAAGAVDVYALLKVLVDDYRIALHLWKSPETTFPAHPVYREFYRDLGFDVLPEYFDELGVPVPAPPTSGATCGRVSSTTR